MGNGGRRCKMIPGSVWDEGKAGRYYGRTTGLCATSYAGSHTMAAHSILHNMLDWGGTLLISDKGADAGRLPENVRNMKEISRPGSIRPCRPRLGGSGEGWSAMTNWRNPSSRRICPAWHMAARDWGRISYERIQRGGRWAP